jgi:hypothetical protein
MTSNYARMRPRASSRGQSSAGGGGEDDLLDLVDGPAAEPQGRHEALRPELALVERGAQRGEDLPVLVGHRVAGRLGEDEVPRPAVGRGHAHVVLALGRVQALERDDDGLPARQALGGRRVQERRRLRVDLFGRHAPLQQRAQRAARQQHAALLEHPRTEAVPRRVVRAGDEEQAARRVAQPVGPREHPASDAHVDGPRRPLRLARAARPLRGPAAPLVVGDLHAAGAGG